MKSIRRAHNLIYNSQRTNLRLPEYGRNVQDMIIYARTIENTEERQAYIEEVVNLMMLMTFPGKNQEDYREKLWRHVFEIAQYDLPGVVPPSGEVPTPETAHKKPDRVDYPANSSQYKHYGILLQNMIKKARKMEPGTVRDGFVSTIGGFMKLAYKTWNKEHYVSDEIIKTDLFNMSEGELTLDDERPIDIYSGGSSQHRADKGEFRQNNNNKKKKGFKNNNNNNNNLNQNRFPNNSNNNNPNQKRHSGNNSNNNNSNNNNNPNRYNKNFK